MKTVEVTQSATGADVTVLGEHRTGTCTTAPVLLDGVPITINPPVSDPFTIRIHQPNGMVLTKIIRVE